MPSLHRALAPTTIAMIGISMALAAYGSDSDSGSGKGSTSDAAIVHAKSEVERYSASAEVKIPALASAPPKGKTVAQVNCTLPTCSVGEMEAPVEALGWELEVFEYDLTKGPQDYVRAFDQALDSKPDYLSITMVFPEDIVKDQLDRAEAEGIPVIGAGGVNEERPVAVIQSEVPFLEAGAITADIALADAEGTIDAVIPVDPSIPLHTTIAEGAQAELKEHSPASKAEILELSLAQPAATNVTGIVNYLKRSPDTKYILFGGSSLYAGLQQGLEAAGLADKVKLILAFPFESDIQAVKNGEFIATVAGEATHQWRSVDVMARLSVGEKITEQKPTSSFRIITPDAASLESLDPPNWAESFKAAWGV